MTNEKASTLRDTGSPEQQALVVRSRDLLNRAGYFTLATMSSTKGPWAATLEYAWLEDPLRLVFGSATTSRHGRDIAAAPLVSGSLFVADTAGGFPPTVDGAQFTGECEEIVDDLARYRSTFYTSVFPDPHEREQWSLPLSALCGQAPHRLYLLRVSRWWLVDARTWAEDRVDRRVEVTGFGTGAGASRPCER